MQETANPLFGPIGMTAVLYGLFMAFVAGPEIGDRTIKAQHWPEICQATIAQKAQPQAGPATELPRFDLCMMVFGFYGRDGEEYCRVHGRTWNGAANTVIDLVNARNRNLQEWRMSRATADSSDRCSCASGYVLEKNRTSFAIFAGTARFITPPAVQNLQGELKAALSSSHCAMKG